MKRAMAISLVVALCLGMAAFAVADTGSAPPSGGCTCAPEATCCIRSNCDRSAGIPCKCTVEAGEPENTTMTPDYKYSEYVLPRITKVYSGSAGDSVEVTLSAGTTVLLGSKIYDRREILYNNEQNAGFIVLDEESKETKGDTKAPETPADKEGWVVEGGATYYYQDGEKKYGWLKTEEGNDTPGGLWYYLDTKTGALQTGWLQMNEENPLDNGEVTYYLQPDWGGALLESGWVWDNEYQAWFYLRQDWGGAMARDQWVWDRDYSTWYYVDREGKMLINAITPDGFYVDTSGKWIP